MSAGQMIDDVRLATEHARPIEFFGSYGGLIPTVEDMKQAIESAIRKIC
jgi:2-oxoglutarate ferredoxin oxidoreductase subunit alpha